MEFGNLSEGARTKICPEFGGRSGALVNNDVWRINRNRSEEWNNTTELRLGVSLYAMPPTTSIPRFLLPQRGAIWRTRLSIPTSTSLTIRSASNKKRNSTSKPLVLEKPSKFVPPSHPARLRKEGPRYPGPPLSDEEIARQTKKKYPNMMPPEGSFMHWFMMNRTIHMWITLVL